MCVCVTVGYWARLLKKNVLTFRLPHGNLVGVRIPLTSMFHPSQTGFRHTLNFIGYWAYATIACTSHHLIPGVASHAINQTNITWDYHVNLFLLYYKGVY